MGLDMWLTKKVCVKNYDFQELKDRNTCLVKLGGKVREDISPDRVCEVTEEILYWRKANHIHKWFVDNVQKGVDNCGKYYVTKQQLMKLAEDCEFVVMNRKKLKGLEGSVLPTESGFFFGSTNYDEYYFDECKRTAKTIRGIIDEIFMHCPEGLDEWRAGEFYYESSW